MRVSFDGFESGAKFYFDTKFSGTVLKAVDYSLGSVSHRKHPTIRFSLGFYTLPLKPVDRILGLPPVKGPAEFPLTPRVVRTK